MSLFGAEEDDPAPVFVFFLRTSNPPVHQRERLAGGKEEIRTQGHTG